MADTGCENITKDLQAGILSIHFILNVMRQQEENLQIRSQQVQAGLHT